MNPPPKFSKIKRQEIDLKLIDQVSKRFLPEYPESPLVIEPNGAVDLTEWLLCSNGIDALLLSHGAILFRGFGISTSEAFRKVALAICGQLYADNGELPRQNLSDDIYTSTAYPQDRMISWHNENSFLHEWPSKVLFCCLRHAETGGETPICDSRLVYAAVPETIRSKFEKHGIVYTRTYGGGMGLDWTTAFRTSDRAAVEEHCSQKQIEFEWLDDGRLHLRWWRPAIVPHVTTGDKVWFNQVTHFHTHMLGEETEGMLLQLFGEKYLPRHCYYGDGSPIGKEEVDAICGAFRKVQIAFPWMNGDVMAVDNMMMAHARNPYTGERKLAVAVGSLIGDSDLPR